MVSVLAALAGNDPDAGWGPDEPGFGIYVHWPFCRVKCPYCDFNSHVREQVDQARWRSALIAELRHFARMTPGRTVTSVFFGGGTPSLMPPVTVSAVIDEIARLFDVAPGLEITLEANPTSADGQAFRGFAAAGVNRVSIGIQALSEADLRFLGREHSAAEALATVALARRYFQRLSFDLIYGRPGQTVAAWRGELADALGHAADHLSLYQLTIEQGTKFHAQHRRGQFTMPDDATQADLYDATQAVLAAAGLPAYEISNHARPGAECRHNLTYWRYGDYIGIGPGAHGRLTLGDQATMADKVATRCHRAPEIWLERVERTGHGEQQRQPVTLDQRLAEMLMMGLRLTGGIPRLRVMEECGRDVGNLLDRDGVARMTEAGLLAFDDHRLRATPDGLRVLDGVLARILPG